MNENKAEPLSHKQQMGDQHLGWVGTLLGLAIIFHAAAKDEDWYKNARDRVRQTFSFSSSARNAGNMPASTDVKASGPRP